jgi:hypothetical protein
MTSLKDSLGVAPKREAVIQDACTVLDQEVADKGGISGLAIKGAYKLVQGVKPGFIRQVVDHLLNEFLDALEPLYQEAVTKGQRPGTYLMANPTRVAAALLTVTDNRAAASDGSAVKKTYEKLRPTAQKHVEAAAPRLAQMLDKHAPA